MSANWSCQIYKYLFGNCFLNLGETPQGPAYCSSTNETRDCHNGDKIKCSFSNCLLPGEPTPSEIPPSEVPTTAPTSLPSSVPPSLPPATPTIETVFLTPSVVPTKSLPPTSTPVPTATPVPGDAPNCHWEGASCDPGRNGDCCTSGGLGCAYDTNKKGYYCFVDSGNAPCPISKCVSNQCVDRYAPRKGGCNPSADPNGCCPSDKCSTDIDCKSGGVCTGDETAQSTCSADGGNWEVVSTVTGCHSGNFNDASWGWCRGKTTQRGCESQGQCSWASDSNPFKIYGCLCPAPTSAPTAILSPTPKPNWPKCVTQKQGDANCDGVIDLKDLDIWKQEFLSDTGFKADFNHDTRVTLNDFETWRQNAYK